MQKKKFIVILFIVIILFAGWFLTVRKVTGVEETNKQNALVEEADRYAEKQLYVRAIPLYEEALFYSTDRIAEIQAKLLNAYRAHGDVMELISMIEARIKAGTAAESEYIEAADYYLDRHSADTAMELIKKGISQLGTKGLTDYFEANRYANEIIVTEYMQVTPTADNTLMPAYDGTHWIYIDRSGRDAGIGIYDSATPFNADGYGVVSQNGRYHTILTDGDKYGVDELGVTEVYSMSGSRVLAKYQGKYSYYNYDFQSLTGGSHQYDAITVNQNGVAAVKSGNTWGIIRDNGEIVMDFLLEDVAVNSLGSAYAGGAAMVRQAGSWYLIDTEGNRFFETGFPNAKAPESSDGYIAVANENGKWGFIDRNGQLKIDYQYDDAHSFSNGLAAVKLGETWYYISQKSQRILDSGFYDAQPFHNGVAQAGMADGAALIILDYFEE